MELLVAVALMAVTIVAISEIFNISSEATVRTGAHAEVMAASAAVQQRLSDRLSKIEPGLLIIESPPPTWARSEVPDGPRYFRLRHDRLVFIASASPGEFQSFTDPTRGTPDNPTLSPADSSDALVYFGPGVPLSETGVPRRPRPFDDEAYMLSASEWVLAHRAILLLLDDPGVADWIPPDMRTIAGAAGMLSGGDLYEGYLNGEMDAVVSSGDTRADAATLVKLVRDISPTDFITSVLAADPSWFHALWEPNRCPMGVTLEDPALGDYYTRGGFTFQPRLADFRIEWTDGRRVDPANGDYRMRWFGLRPDPTASPDLDNPNDINYWPVVYGDRRFEWADPDDGTSAPQASYRAIWRADTWDLRPTALRFTYRIYDAGNRLKHPTDVDLDEDGDFDPDDPADQPDLNRRIVTRFGKEFSIVVPIP